VDQEKRGSPFPVKDDNARLRLLATILRDSNDAVTVQDLGGKILVWNKGAERMYGYSEAEALDMSICRIVPDEKRQEALELIEQVKAGKPIESVETKRLTGDGRILDVWLTVTKLLDEDGNIVALATTERDITKQKEMSEELIENIHKKEVLMREIHHRVKNNLAVIQSLLSLSLKNIRDPEAREYINISANRVKSMSMIHDRLYRTQDCSSVKIAEYMHSLVNMLMDFYKTDSNRIKFDCKIPDISLDVDIMIPCGLIVNELITNAIKYAFPDEKRGTIHIELQKGSEDEYTLLVGDDGIGLPEDLNIYQTESLGMQIVTSLVKQMQGSLEVAVNNGTEFKIRFRETRREHNMP
jgi:PAS domain S-box-containing protein